MIHGNYVFGPLGAPHLMKQVRKTLMGEWLDMKNQPFDPKSYKLADVFWKVINEFRRFSLAFWKESPPYPFGIVIAGYSSDSASAEVWEMNLHAKGSPQYGKSMVEHATGWRAYSQPHVAQRLFDGLDERLAERLKELVPPESHAELDLMLDEQAVYPVERFMPLPDAAALARYMVETTAGFSGFTTVPPTVGGPASVACISRHEGFRWEGQEGYHG